MGISLSHLGVWPVMVTAGCLPPPGIGEAALNLQLPRAKKIWMWTHAHSVSSEDRSQAARSLGRNVALPLNFTLEEMWSDQPQLALTQSRLTFMK